MDAEQLSSMPLRPPAEASPDPSVGPVHDDRTGDANQVVVRQAAGLAANWESARATLDTPINTTATQVGFINASFVTSTVAVTGDRAALPCRASMLSNGSNGYCAGTAEGWPYGAFSPPQYPRNAILDIFAGQRPPSSASQPVEAREHRGTPRQVSRSGSVESAMRLASPSPRAAPQLLTLQSITCAT